jgi:hypothetical protein
MIAPMVQLFYQHGYEKGSKFVGQSPIIIHLGEKLNISAIWIERHHLCDWTTILRFPRPRMLLPRQIRHLGSFSSGMSPPTEHNVLGIAPNEPGLACRYCRRYNSTLPGNFCGSSG